MKGLIMGYLQACELLLGKFFNRPEEFGLIFLGWGRFFMQSYATRLHFK